MVRISWLLCSTVVAIISAQYAAVADTTVSGSLYAASPCDLQPLRETESHACIQMILPIGGRLALTPAKGRPITVPVSKSGRFAAKLRSGTYTLKLTRARVYENPATLPADDLHLITGKVTVRAKPLKLNIGVIHKSYIVLTQ
jgi:hypothetical protein